MIGQKTYYSFLETMIWLLSITGIRRDESGNVPITFRAIGLWFWLSLSLFFIILKMFCGQMLKDFLSGVFIGAVALHLIMKQVII